MYPGESYHFGDLDRWTSSGLYSLGKGRGIYLFIGTGIFCVSAANVGEDAPLFFSLQELYKQAGSCLCELIAEWICPSSSKWIAQFSWILQYSLQGNKLREHSSGYAFSHML